MLSNQYRKKPVVIEAVKIEKRMDLTSPAWWAEAIQSNAVIVHGMGKFTRDQPWVEISTLEGVMRGDDGDWIIRGVKGELYPCKPDIFSQTYEPAALRAQADAGQFKCAAREQGTAGGHGAADCDWPTCSCDPHASRVIEALQEAGHLIHPSLPAAQGLSAEDHDRLWDLITKFESAEDAVLVGTAAADRYARSVRALLSRAATVAEPSEACAECNGAGKVDVTHSPLRDGYTETVRECCDACGGTGTSEAAQQQAEHVVQHVGIAPEHVGIQQAEPVGAAEDARIKKGIGVLRYLLNIGSENPDELVGALMDSTRTRDGVTTRQALESLWEALAATQRARGDCPAEDTWNCKYCRQVKSCSLHSETTTPKKAEPVGDERAAFEKYVASRRYGKFSTRELLRPCWEAALQFAAQSGQRAGVAEGWCLYSADFSMNATNPANWGTVMLRRDGAGYKWWHALSDEEREKIDLFVSGRGTTFEAALQNANEKTAIAAAPTQQQERSE
ncbi:zinc finger-like domain-containing protein [Ralstonia insidiosa]|uniref:zinc finger-like domain-containing protein n=1 Tax=Ralstonia insidiosa TaxID=190721 RepID=UPI001BAEFFD3|nr:zinc finger-like domain-containing protein [Ralstonia insidiosa]